MLGASYCYVYAPPTARIHWCNLKHDESSRDYGNLHNASITENMVIRKTLFFTLIIDVL